MARLVFHGAAQQVTGSMHILEAGGKVILLDCGMFQGRRQQARELNLRHPVPPRDVYAVVVSHAHIDHVGRLPLLTRDGFRGVIHTTHATKDLAAVILADAAHLQEEDARHLNKHRRPGEPPVVPMYEGRDAVAALAQVQSYPYGRWFKVAPGLHARYFDAGHILGSAGIELEITENDRKTTLVFSGDVGRWGMPILRDPAPLPRCDYLICESTYGGRLTDPVDQLKPRLGDVVRNTLAKGGRLLIPAFSVGRTQAIVYYLRELFDSGQTPRVPVYIDSPMAVNATDIFRLHPECYDMDARAFGENGGILDGRQFHYVRSRDESKRINRLSRPCIVISASGMCEGGRILHHLLHSIEDQRNTILIVGFQGASTLGRRIVERDEFVSIFGEKVRLAAEVVVLNGFSAHADAAELKAYTDPLAGICRRAFLVHGEPDQAAVLAETMMRSGHKDVRIPAMGEGHPLD
jgi:metallo-beta-lactamase family protein